jgi:hypothetical protein
VRAQLFGSQKGDLFLIYEPDAFDAARGIWKVTVQPTTAHLHARHGGFHHGSAHACTGGLKLLLGDELNVAHDKQEARTATGAKSRIEENCPLVRAGPVTS